MATISGTDSRNVLMRTLFDNFIRGNADGGAK
jgi:hypothetical protein